VVAVCKGILTVGIDLGTSSVKALAIDENGVIRGQAQQDYPTYRPAPDRVEQDPKDWWIAVKKAIEELGAKVDLGQVATIAMSGQLNGLVLLDKDLNPLCNSAIWLDQRATEQADFLTAHYGDSLQKLALSTPGPIHVLSKLLWYKDNQSNLLDRTHKIVFAKDFITLRLAGVCVTDKSDAGAAFMLDLEKRDWAWELLSELGISSSILPSLHESPELVGRVTADCANETGLKAGISVVVGAGDMAALAIGTGVTTPDTACATIGTAGHVAYYQEMVPEQLPSGLFLMCHAVPGKYFLHGLVMTGGYSLTWFVENFVHAENTQTASEKANAYRILLDQAAEVPAGSNGLIFLPFLQGASTPYNNPDAKACFAGITASATKAMFARAILEGVAYNFRDSFELLQQMGRRPKRITVGEGGSRHPLWPTIVASVLGFPVSMLTELESSAFGAAIIAGVAVGVWPSFSDASHKAIQVADHIAPDLEDHSEYTKKYRLYQQVYAAMEPLYSDMTVANQKGV
jgi:xylulokinase